MHKQLLMAVKVKAILVGREVFPSRAGNLHCDVSLICQVQPLGIV